MKKLLKLCLILIIIFAFFVNIPMFNVYAVNNTTEDVPTPTSANENNTQNNETNTTKKSTENDNSNNSNKNLTQVSSVPNPNEGELTPSDIINILLIATGVVIILLAVAIILKIK